MVSKKLFVRGINQDDAHVLLETNEYLNGLNIRFATSENGKVGQLSNVEGNVLKNTTTNSTGASVTFTLPAGTNTTIGAADDTPNKRVFFFNKNSNGNHGIYCYDADNGIVYTVLKSSQVENGLGFSNDIHSCAVVDDMLYWTDFQNPQRRINVEAGIKTNHPTYTTSETAYSTVVVGAITGGTSYTNATYNNVPLTGGTGSGAQASIVVSGNRVTRVTITLQGFGYSAGDVLSASAANIGGTGSGFSFVNRCISNYVINLIRNQPWSPVTVEKKKDNLYPNNFIRSEAFQFSYRFVYRDGEMSTFSPLSELMNYNTKKEDTDGVNFIEIKIPYSQKIEQDVVKVELAAKFVFGGALFIVKIFENISDFVAHNAMATQLEFDFYNDTVGIAVDGISATKPFDSIPLKSFTLEAAKNRLFLGNNIDGYEAPKSTSLNATALESGDSTVYGYWALDVYGVQSGIRRFKWFLYIPSVGANSGYYDIFPDPVPVGENPTSYPTTWAYSPSALRFADENAILTYYGIDPADREYFYVTGERVTVTGSGFTVASIVGTTVFKSDSNYKLGVVFYDYAGRKCGVVKGLNDITTADRTATSVAYTKTIEWSLSNQSSVSEIPDWAHYYSIVTTRSLRVSNFFQLRADDIKYISKKADGTYDTPTGTYSSTAFGVAVKVTSLFANNIGYQYDANSGDLIKLYKPSTASPYRLRIKDQWSDYIIVELSDLGSLAGTISTWLYEVYTPYTQSFDEFYYERANTYPVLNPGNTSRQYSVLAGSISGDVVMLERGTGTTYTVEGMSPQDAYWQRWNTNAGRPNSIIDGKQSHKKTTIYWSNVVILGTKVNGLSTFDALNQEQLPYEMASIQKLHLVSKAETEGTIMLAIGEQETASVYLGETQVFDNTGSSFLAKSSGVIGNINILRGSYGTINPESVTRFQGLVYWFDAIKGSVVSYSTNGLFPISNNKMLKYFRKIGQDVLSLGLKFYGGFDPYHNEVLMFAPRKSALPSGARLTDMQLSSESYAFTTVSAPSTVTVIGQASYSISGGPTGPNQATVVGSTGPVTFSYVGTGSTTYGPSAVRPSAAGSYSVTATVASDGAYDAGTSAPFPFVIQAAFVFEADYILLTYQFTDGLDLDTRTRVVIPDIGQDAQTKYVGWSTQSAWPTTGTPILDWGGDNTGTGFEAVLLNLNQLKTSYPSFESMVVDMRAFWYNAVGVNPVSVQATLWKGGTPIEQGGGGSPAFSFTNPTATGTFVISSVGKVITSAGLPSKSASSGERVATLTYNLLTGAGVFNTNDTTTPSV